MQLCLPYPANFNFSHAPFFPKNTSYYHLVFLLFLHKLRNEILKENNKKTSHESVPLEVSIMIFRGQESLRQTLGSGFRTCLGNKRVVFYKVKNGGLVQRLCTTFKIKSKLNAKGKLFHQMHS